MKNNYRIDISVKIRLNFKCKKAQKFDAKEAINKKINRRKN